MSYLNWIVFINDIQRYAVQTLHNYCAIIITTIVWVTLSYSISIFLNCLSLNADPNTKSNIEAMGKLPKYFQFSIELQLLFMFQIV